MTDNKHSKPAMIAVARCWALVARHITPSEVPNDPLKGLTGEDLDDVVRAIDYSLRRAIGNDKAIELMKPMAGLSPAEILHKGVAALADTVNIGDALSMRDLASTAAEHIEDEPTHDATKELYAGISLAAQLLELECAIHADAATDEDWYSFVDTLTEEQRHGAGLALQAMWGLCVEDLVPTEGAASIAMKVSESQTLRDWSVGIALLRDFNRKEALKLATAAASRMKPPTTGS
ncbi:hypothetical protein MHPYR_590003 [uncultured Mycobacterium sp.]|uniref:Uncharacterized protein n=1 Tax=uncultured Mycobacterium sp. TaxID=171292 RepID=A0A1Y5PIB6_9MYCO|nr:hypothetical protein MHPYR_590003 [uncultured Mycobacterium sp.]